MTRGNTQKAHRRSGLLWVAAASIALSAPLASWGPAYAGTADWPHNNSTAPDQHSDPWDDYDAQSWDSRDYDPYYANQKPPITWDRHRQNTPGEDSVRHHEDSWGEEGSGHHEDSWDEEGSQHHENAWGEEGSWNEEESGSEQGSQRHEDSWAEEGSWNEEESGSEEGSRHHENSWSEEGEWSEEESGSEEGSWNEAESGSEEGSWSRDNSWKHKGAPHRERMVAVDDEAVASPHMPERYTDASSRKRKNKGDLNNATATNNYVSIFVPHYGLFPVVGQFPAATADGASTPYSMTGEAVRPAGMATPYGMTGREAAGPNRMATPYRMTGHNRPGYHRPGHHRTPSQRFWVPTKVGNPQQTSCAVAGGNTLPGSCLSVVAIPLPGNAS
ncbi:hypothetical protein AB0J42_36740 [Nonomuraea sp. NPDC049649]|uniref:hypothetical protein n=1 Tax=Nonomuraea sp. NPDC049649 TaxID=3155776 RepID=UPI0034407263